MSTVDTRFESNSAGEPDARLNERFGSASVDLLA